MTSRSKPRSGGFTLLELVIVLLIVALGAGLTLMSLGNTKGREELRSEAVGVYTELRHLHERSLMERTPFALVANAENGLSYSVLKNGKPSGAPHVLRAGLKVGGGPVVFYAKGNAAGPPFTVTDTKGRGYAIEVDSVTGAATIKRLQPS